MIARFKYFAKVAFPLLLLLSGATACQKLLGPNFLVRPNYQRLTIPTELIDSVQVFSYNGGLAFPPPPFPAPDASEEDRKLAEMAYTDDLVKQFPGYDPQRDMALPPGSPLLLNQEGKYHPSIVWKKKRSISGGKKEELLLLLNGQVRKKINTDPLACFRPRHGILAYQKGTVVSVYSICLECRQVVLGTDLPLRYLYDVDTKALGKALQQLGFSSNIND